MDIRLKAVLLRDENVKSRKEICELYDISERTLRRWIQLYRKGGFDGLKPEKTGQKKVKWRKQEPLGW